MIISPHPQGSVEWLQSRAGIVTASEMDQLVSPTGKVRTGQMPDTYLNKKLAEWWTGGPIETFQSYAMEQGHILEEEAIPWLSFQWNIEIKRVGLITTDDGFVGCSPDGLIDGSGVEIKCPQTATHIGYLRAGVLPPEYVHQVQASLFVTGFQRWNFVSYRRGLPALVLSVLRDDEYQTAIEDAVELFKVKFDEEKLRLIGLNGGPPKRFIQKPKPVASFVSDPNDIIP